MADYAKFDKIVDSDEEEERRAAADEDAEDADGAGGRGSGGGGELSTEEREAQLRQKDEVDGWLKARVRLLFPSPEDLKGPPELDPWDEQPPRRISDEERSVLAMFMVVNHFERFEINVGRHHEILNLARQHRWLEEDPGTLELLCQLLRMTKNGGGSSGGRPKALDTKAEDASLEGKVEGMLVSAINTLAAPPRTGCSDGYGKIFKLFALISDPQTSDGWDARAKYVKKEYAADAIFSSLMPKTPDDSAEGASLFGPLAWLALALLLFVLAGAVFALFVGGRSRPRAALADFGGAARASRGAGADGAGLGEL